MEVDKGTKSYKDILWLTRCYEYFSTQYKGIILPELIKTNNALCDVFIGCYFEIDELGINEYCNTSRESINFAIKSILNREEFFNAYESTTKSDWCLIWASNYKESESISNYLKRCLSYTNDYLEIEKIFESLYFQKNSEINIKEYLFSDSKFDSVQRSAINYIKNLDLKEYLDVLKKLQNSNLFSERNIPILKVTLCKLKYGQEGLINLFNDNNDIEIRMEIINCYQNYKTKEFAKILLKALEDENKLENGFYPVRNNAQTELDRELYSKLIEWFEIEIIDYIKENTQV